MKGKKFSHGAPFRNEIEGGLIDPTLSIQVAIRNPYTELAAPYAREAGMTVIEMHEIESMGLPAVIGKIRSVVGDMPAYLSFAVDADPAMAPGTGTPVVGGLTLREAMKILQEQQGTDIGIIGVEIVAGLSCCPGARYGPQAVRAQSGLIR
jgi:arginase family enzyme